MEEDPYPSSAELWLFGVSDHFAYDVCPNENWMEGLWRSATEG